MESELSWKKCKICGKSHFGPQKWIDNVEVCPHCDASDLEPTTYEAAMKTILYCLESDNDVS